MELRENLSSLSVSPQKILKIVISIAVVLLLMWLFMISRMDTGTSKAGSTVVKERADSLQTLLHEKGEAETSVEESPSGIFKNALVTFVVLMVVLAVVWFWSDKKSHLTGDIRNREISTQILGEGARIKIVEVNEEIWVLGVTSASVNLLHRYAQKDWKEQVKEKSTEESKFSKLFRTKV